MQGQSHVTYIKYNNKQKIIINKLDQIKKESYKKM